MSNQTLKLTDSLYHYLLSVSLRDNSIYQALRSETTKMDMGNMQIAPEQAQFMGMLVSLIGAKKALEVGVFTGYSTLVVAEALPQDGIVIACDINQQWTEIAQKYWRLAGVDHKVDLRLAPANDTLNELIRNGQAESFDFAFIDANKEQQLDYYEHCLTLIRPGGLITIDNVLWGGSVIDPTNQSSDTKAIRQFNQFLFADNRVDISLVPIGDGLTLARKKC